MGAIKELNIQDIISKYHLDFFVETGTGMAHSLEYIVNNFNFKWHFSSEIVTEIFNQIKDKTFKTNNVSLFNLNSPSFLRNILPQINSNTLFWLDAHFPGSDYCGVPYDYFKNKDERLPLEQELDVIYDLRKDYKDVIICDDLRIYEEADYEAGNLSNRNLQHIGHFNLNFLEKFKNKYNIEKSLRHEGYLYLYPKS